MIILFGEIIFFLIQGGIEFTSLDDEDNSGEANKTSDLYYKMSAKQRWQAFILLFDYLILFVVSFSYLVLLITYSSMY